MTIAEQLRNEGMQKGVQQGIQQGIEQGVRQETIRIARQLLELDSDLESIAKLTDLV